MRIPGLKAIRVLDDDSEAVTSLLTREGHAPACGDRDVLSDRHGDIGPVMERLATPHRIAAPSEGGADAASGRLKIGAGRNFRCALDRHRDDRRNYGILEVFGDIVR